MSFAASHLPSFTLTKCCGVRLQVPCSARVRTPPPYQTLIIGVNYYAYSSPSPHNVRRKISRADINTFVGVRGCWEIGKRRCANSDAKTARRPKEPSKLAGLRKRAGQRRADGGALDP
jgi:hypothetical protein